RAVHGGTCHHVLLGEDDQRPGVSVHRDVVVAREHHQRGQQGLLSHPMRRRTTGLLIAGWLLGLLTAFVWPAVSTEHRTIVVERSDVGDVLVGRTRAGWNVTSTTTIDRSVIVQLERPRYLSVYEDLKERPRGSWCWLTTG